MTDRMALLQSVLANPDDDIPRLVYADWLEEFGSDADVARAHFIRAEIEAVGLPANSPERIEAESIAAKLFNKHGTTWNAELPEICTGRTRDFAGSSDYAIATEFTHERNNVE